VSTNSATDLFGTSASALGALGALARRRKCKSAAALAAA
jgi:hypothetical protein